MFGIKTGMILKDAPGIHNKPKHDAKVPNPETCIQIMSEVKKIVDNYVCTDTKLEIIDDATYGDGNQWYEICERTNDFANWYSYIFICGKIEETNSEGLFSIPWDLVIDFDPSSEIDGLYKQYVDTTEVQPKIRTLEMIDSKRAFKVSNNPYWVMANGMSDKPESIVPDTKWRAVYGRNLDDLLGGFKKAYAKPAKVFVYNISNEKNLVKIVDEFQDAYESGDEIEFFVIEPKDFFSQIDYKNFMKENISFSSFCNKLSESVHTSLPKKPNEVCVPTSAGVKCKLEPNFIAELGDSFELVYEGIESSIVDENALKAKYFYRGDCSISWYGIAKGFDVVRDAQKDLADSIEKNIKEKARVLKTILYEPGVGGTTMLRRLAWQFSSKHPTLILQSYSAEETCHSVQKLYDITHMPTLIFADSNTVEVDEAKLLQEELKKLGFKFVICYFQRKMRRLSGQTAASIIDSFNNREAIEMSEKLDQYIDGVEIRDNLRSICESVDSIERTPFIMSMYAFSDDFRGTKPYIGKYLDAVNGHIKKILFAVSLADFGNVTLPLQYFGNLYPGSSVADFVNDIIPEIDKLVRVEEIGGKTCIRIRYHQFGEEILRQMSLGYEAESISLTNLIDYILEFIEDSRNKRVGYAQDEVDVMRNLFITRTADVDSERPVFSALIQKLREETKRSNDGTYDETNDSIERIFNKLFEVYPEEPHFAAHLARYYFYIERNYDKGFHFINAAIELSDATRDAVDPLILHMKAMGYSSIITQSLIREVYDAAELSDKELVKDKIEEIEETAEKAFDLFEAVRKSNSGEAGHVSDIRLCISIANMARNLMEETDYSKFVFSEESEWAVKYIDRATVLWEECKGIANDPSSEEMGEIETRLNSVTASLQNSIGLWEEYVEKSNGKNKIRGRRLLAQAYNRRINQTTENIDQKQVARIVELMESNMLEDPDNPANIRIWFEAIQRLNVENPEELMWDAMSKLNRWVALTDSVEAHFYRFILKFLQALEGSSRAEEDLKKLLRELKTKSANEYNRTATRYWLMNTGKGLAALMTSSRSRREKLSDDEMIEKLKNITGRISNNYVNDAHAYINWRGLDIYFNPSSTRGEIDKSKVNQRVIFGVGFSYDGPRAFNTSIRLAGLEEIETISILPETGKVVKCEVIKNTEYYVRVKIIGADKENETASIHINELKEPYSSKRRPDPGEVLETQVIGRGFDQKRNESTWKLTMYIEGEEPEVNPKDSAFAIALNKANARKTKNK